MTIADTRKDKDADCNPASDIVHIPAPWQVDRVAQLTPVCGRSPPA